MPDYEIPTGGIGVHEITLVANTQIYVWFADDLPQVEIVSHDGAAPVYFTVDGTNATVAGVGCYVVPPAIGSIVTEPPTAGPTRVHVISAGTPKISVCRAA